ncbi:MAG: amidohydrolase family protein [Novosphingobium sp.]
MSGIDSQLTVRPGHRGHHLRRFGHLLPSLMAGLLACTTAAHAELPLRPERVLTLHPERTTWSAVDVSRDGRALVFDMLGDLYVMPATGGQAQQITNGLAFDSQPRFSPDGKWITFTSDRSGSENIWIARSDGSQARRITAFDDDTAMASPEWSADGQSVFASRYRPDLNNYELWRFPLSGTPALMIAVKPSPDAPRDAWRSTLDVSASADGRWLYYAQRTGGLEFDAPSKWTVLRRDLASGEEQSIVAGSGGRGTQEESFFAPRLSHDGKRLSYVTRRGARSELRLRDLETGTDRAVGETELDSMQASSWQGLVPGMAFTPTDDAIVLSRDGRFVRQPLDGREAIPLPRTIAGRVAVGPSTRFPLQGETGPVTAKLAMAPATSPDGKRIVFAALGGLWIDELAEARSRRLGIDLPMPAQPSWSPDAATIAFATWSEAEGGAIWLAPIDGSGAPRQLSTLAAYYRNPVFTPDGAHLLALRSPLEERRQANFEFGPLRQSELVEIDLSSGTVRVIASGNFGGRPHFAGSDATVYLISDQALIGIDLADGGMTKIAHVTGPGYYFAEGNAPADDMRLSPDGAKVAAAIADRLYIMPRPVDPDEEIDVLAPGTPARAMPGSGADWFEWSSPDSIDVTVGAQFARLDVTSATAETVTRLTAEAPRARPTGSLLLRGARILTMAHNDAVIENGDVLVTGDRIAALGPSGSISVPSGTMVRDVSGKTVMPGFIDVHDHFGSVRRNNLAAELWGLRARLAYGVTTSFDPSTLSIDHMAYQGLVDAGIVLGPRLRSTGPAVFSKERIHSLDDARRVLSRYSDGYGMSNLKEYRTGSRAVRQWVAIAAREQHLLPTTEGALSLKLDLTQILDGYAGNEHALPAPPLGDDVIELMRAMHTSYDTTLSITNSGGPAMDWIIAHDDPVADAKLRRFWPASAIRQKLEVGRDWHPLSTERFPYIVRDVARMAKAGVLVGIGSHGEAPGIGYHWEMQAHALGGMTPAAILHAATAGSAETIGLLDDLGTLEPGKFADLLVLDADPRDDLRNANRIAQVMRGGFLYQASDLQPLWPDKGDAPHAWFENTTDEQWLPVVEPKNPEEHR